ncbi:MAG: 3-phosphoshikimate 1-carboxyvinyltransferase, partial [Candidatus Geothermincolia bacterium]
MDRTFSGGSTLSGEAVPPGDKSISHRLALFGAVAQGDTLARNFLFSEDCESTVSCLRALGVDIEEDRGAATLLVHGRGWEGLSEPPQVLDAGNSGTTLRSLAGLLAGRPFNSVITGDASLRRRPMRRVIEPLREMGAEISGQDENLAPLHISGAELSAIDHTLSVASAQVKLALLLAGLQATGRTWVRAAGSSRDHSERLLLHMGADIRFEGTDVGIAARPLAGVDVEVPGDLSSAAFLLAAAALLPGSSLKVLGVGLNPTRAGFLSVLNTMGAMVMESGLREEAGELRGDLEVRGGSLRAITIEPHRVPAMIDEIPLIAVVATRAQGTTVVTGAGELRVKESDRIAAICSELRNMGADL